MRRSATPRLKVKMSSSTPDAYPSEKMLTVAVLTVSDSCSRGEKVDLSGPAVAEALERRNFQVVARGVVADERAAIQEKLIELCQSGSTGSDYGRHGHCSARRNSGSDPSRLRATGRRNRRTDADCGNAKDALCRFEPRGVRRARNQPDIESARQSNGAVESLEAVIDLLPHALELMAGRTEH